MGWRDWLGGLFGAAAPLEGLAEIALSPEVLNSLKLTLAAARSQDRIGTAIAALELYRWVLTQRQSTGYVPEGLRLSLVISDAASGAQLRSIELPTLYSGPRAPR